MTQAHGNGITVRPAGADQIRRLSLIADATFLETFAGQIDGNALVAHCREKHAPAYLARLLDDGASAWLALLADAPIGYAMLTPPELDAARPGDVELKKIYVLSRFHGTGTGARLFDAALAGAAGHDRLLLGVKDDNTRAIRFYEKQDFARIGTRRFDVGGTLYDDIVFARDLERT